jgi:hypothetical protein
VTNTDDDRALTTLLTDHVPDPPEELRMPPAPGSFAARVRRRRVGTLALVAAAVVLVTAAGIGAAVGLGPDRSAPAGPTNPPSRTPADHPITPGDQIALTSPGIIDRSDYLLRVGVSHRACDAYTLHADETPGSVSLYLDPMAVSGDCGVVEDEVSVQLRQPLRDRQVLNQNGQPVAVLHERDRLDPGYLPPGVGHLADVGVAGASDRTLEGQTWRYAAYGNDLSVSISQCYGATPSCAQSGDVVKTVTVRAHTARVRKARGHMVPPLTLQWEANGYTFTIGMDGRGYSQDELIAQAKLIANNLY